MAIQAILWDLDGVILDSAEEHRLAWHAMAKHEEIPFTDEQFSATFGKRNDEIFHELWPQIHIGRVKELSEAKEAHFRNLIGERASFLPGAQELMRKAREQGFKQALASSTPVKNLEFIVDVLGLKRYLDVFVSGETVPKGKPAPDIFLKAASLLDIEPGNCVVFEDAVAGVAAALAGGMKCVAVAGTRDLEGLRRANIVVHDLTEMSIERIRALA